MGYFHTFREIGQQPSTWLRTCELMRTHAAEIARPGGWDFVPVAVGSGSSESAGACAPGASQESRDQRGGRASGSFAHPWQVCVARSANLH